MHIDIPTLEALEAYVRGDELSVADRSRLRAWITTDPQLRDDIAHRRWSCLLVVGSCPGPNRTVDFDAARLARHLGLLPPTLISPKRAKRLAAAALDPDDPDHAEAMGVLGLPVDAMRDDSDDD